MNQLKVLPRVNWGSNAPPSRGVLNDTGTPASERQLTLAAENAPVRITYGTDVIGAQIANVLYHSNKWVVQVIWGEGPISAVEKVWFSNEDVPAGVTATHYLGNPGQGVNSALATAFAAKGVTYTDTLPGIAYSVFVIDGEVQGWDRITAKIKGRLLFDPRTGTTAWSNNPGLAYADFLRSTVYGCGFTLVEDSVGDLADLCDELVGGEKRRLIGLTIDSPAPVMDWVQTLRTYAGAFTPILTNAGWKLVADRPTATSASFDHFSGQILSISPIVKRGVLDTPTVIRVMWTDTTTVPWRDREAVVRLPGVLEGTTPRRESDIRLPGIQRYSQAVREATERLNKLTLSDISFSLDVFDEGVVVEEGDVISVTHPPLSNKLVRVVGVSGEMGRYNLSVEEYDPSVYSDSVETEPTSPDTDLPSPSAAIPPTDLSVVEEVFQHQNGTYASRLFIEWVAPEFPFVDHYRINVMVSGEVVSTGTARGAVFRTPSVQEGVEYVVNVITVSSVGTSSDPVSETITALGKYLPPGNVASLTGIEVGGEVRLRWPAAMDIDIWRYEVRYGPVGSPWSAAYLIDRVDGLRLVAGVVPAGTWDFMIKAVDSVGNYSPTEARRTLTVTLDTNAFLVDEVELDTPTTGNMAEYTLGRLDDVRRFITEDGESVASKFTGALTGYPGLMALYNNTDSEWSSEVVDFGLQLSGNWAALLEFNTLEGPVDAHIDISNDGVVWSESDELVAKTSGRFARSKVNGVAPAVFAVQIPYASIRVDATPRMETGVLTSLASGPTVINLENVYAAVKAITITPIGSSPRTYSVDDIVIGDPSKFDVYIWDAAGNQVASQFQWKFEGV